MKPKTCETCLHGAFVSNHRVGYCCNKKQMDVSKVNRNTTACHKHEERLDLVNKINAMAGGNRLKAEQ